MKATSKCVLVVGGVAGLCVSALLSLEHGEHVSTAPVDRAAIQLAAPTKSGPHAKPRSNGQLQVPRGHGAAQFSASAAGSPAADWNAAGGPAPPADHRQAILRWQKEAPNESWTAVMRDYLTSSFADLGTRGSLVEISCRSTLCRAVLQFDSVEEVTRYADQAGDPDARRWLTAEQRDGKFLIDVVVAR